jgi:hypothetical protein
MITLKMKVKRIAPFYKVKYDGRNEKKRYPHRRYGHGGAKAGSGQRQAHGRRRQPDTDQLKRASSWHQGHAGGRNCRQGEGNPIGQTTRYLVSDIRSAISDK